MQSFRQLIEKQFRMILPDKAEQTDPNRPPIDLSVNYVVHAGVGAILWWLESGQLSTPEQVAIWLNQLSRANVNISLGSNGKAGRQ